MRIVFIGAVEFSRSTLAHVLSLGGEVVGVCTLENSGFNSDHVDLSELSIEHDIPWRYATDINSTEVLNWIKQKRPDVIFCFGWSTLLKEELLKLPPLGVVGFHPAALPANRGRHPLIWALVLGLKETASTFFFMDAGADSGELFSQRRIFIEEEDDASVLYAKVTNSALEQIEEFLPKLLSNKFSRQKQNIEHANSWRKRNKADGNIDWRMSARTIQNLVRGLAKPYPGASFVFNGVEIKVWKALFIADTSKNIEPGKVVSYKNDMPVIKCGEDAVCLLATEPLFKPEPGCYL
jgi:methionyl-tRNA formyltransferase